VRARSVRVSHDAILAAARDMVASEGLAGLSMRPLAARLGVTAPALYAHFDGKEALLEALAVDEFTRLTVRIAASGRNVDDPIEVIKAQCRAYVRYAVANPSLFEVIFLFRPAWTPGAGVDELPAASKAFELSAAAVAEAIDAGVIAERDPLMASLTIWAAVHGVATLLLARPRLGKSFESALVTSVINSIVAGLQRSEGS
jgi:AcrR family transcriptional regulator